MSIKHKNWRIGDTRTPLYVLLQQENEAGTLAAVDLTGLTVSVRIVDGATGTVIVAATSTGVTVTDAAAGKVTYTLPDAAVVAAGYLFVSFIVTSAGKTDHFPVLHNELQLRVCSHTESAKDAYDAAVV